MKIVRFLVMLCLPLIAAGCVSDGFDDGGGAGGGLNGEIAFEIGFALQTRVATDAYFECAWEDGDEIGIFAATNGSALASSGNYIHNAKLTYDNGTWTPAVPLYWPDSGNLDFFAYYPYDASATDPTAIAFNVSADQSLAGAFGASDLLAAASDNSGAGWAKGSTVALTFTHSLALVQVDITDRGAGVPEYDADYLLVTMQGVQTSATLDLGSTGGAAAGGNAGSVTMTRFDTGNTDEWIYRAVVPSQTLSEEAVLFTFEQDLDGDFADFFFFYRPSQVRTLTAGEYTEFDIETSRGEGNYSAEARRFIRWAQETDDWKTTDFTLAADIDLTGYDWKPVGDWDTPFTQTFDGGGYTITGLSVDTDAYYAGLFGYVDGGEVRNVNVSGTVTGTATSSIVGGIASWNSGGTITGCSFNGTVTGAGIFIGGIAGVTYGYITGCSFSGTITGTNDSGYIGGIAGDNSGGTITGSWSAAKSVTGGSGSNIGGIAGWNSYGTIRYCHWLWDGMTGFDGNTVGYDDEGNVTVYCSSFATVSELNALIPDMNTEILSSGWQWATGADLDNDWPTIQKLP